MDGPELARFESHLLFLVRRLHTVQTTVCELWQWLNMSSELLFLKSDSENYAQFSELIRKGCFSIRCAAARKPSSRFVLGSRFLPSDSLKKLTKNYCLFNIILYYNIIYFTIIKHLSNNFLFFLLVFFDIF